MSDSDTYDGIWNYTVKYFEPGNDLEGAIQPGPMTVSRRGGIIHQSSARKRLRKAKWASYTKTGNGDEIMLTCIQLGKGDDRHWHTLKTIRHAENSRPTSFDLHPGQRWYTGIIEPVDKSAGYHNGTWHGPG